MLQGAAGAAGGGYSVDNSMVLDDGSSQYLSGPALSSGSERIGTYSFWTKRGNLGTQQEIYTQYRTSSSNMAFRVRFLSGDTLDIVCENDAGSVILRRTTTQVFRDPHAFLHVHIQVNGNQTDDTCCTLTINGSAVSDFSTKTNLSSGTDLNLFTSSKSAFIGSTPGPAGYYDGYFSEFVAIDGGNAAATSFGEYDTNGVWRPIDVTDVATDRDQIPALTSNSAPSPYAVTASSEDGAGSEGYRMFANGSSSWRTTSGAGGVADIVIDVGSANAFAATSLVLTGTGDAATRCPTNFTFEGSNTGSFSGEETVLYTGSSLSWSASETKTFTFSNTTSFRYYKLDVTSTSGGTYVEIDEGEIRKEVTGDFGTNGFYMPFTDSTNLGADGNYADTAYTSVNFDGTNDYLTRGGALTGLSDGDAGSTSFWFKFNGGDGSDVSIFTDNAGHIHIRRGSDNKIRMLMHTSGASELVDIQTSSTYIADGNWHHCMASWNTTSDTQHLYIDGVDQLSVNNSTTGTIDYTQTDYAVGARTSGTNKINSDLAEFYFTNEYIDLSSSANRDKFFNSTTGEPVDVGSDGSTPTGTAAVVYLSGATSTWHTNDGSGGGFTENGALTDGAAVRPVNANDFNTSGSPTQSSSTPTKVCCNFSPLIVSDLSFTLSEGNRKVVVSNDSVVRGSMALPTSGKYYFEVECVNDNTYGLVGFMRADKVYDKVTSGRASQTAGLGGYDWEDSAGLFRRETTTAYTGSTWTTGDILGFYIDYDNDAIWASKNGTLENGASQSEVEAGTTTNAIWTGTLATDGSVVPYVGCNGGSNMTFKINCGQEPFNTSLYAGYSDLSSTSFYTNAAPAIEDPGEHFQMELVPHDGSSTAFTLNWNADTYDTLFWLKNRDASEEGYIIDGVRGYDKYNRLSDTSAVGTSSTIISVSGTTITLGSTLASNNYVVHCWKMGLAASRDTDNSDGTITGTSNGLVISANTTARQSIITWTGTGSGGTIGHGLGVKPQWYFGRNYQDSGNEWRAYHQFANASPASGYLRVDYTTTFSPDTTTFNNTNPDADTISVGSSGHVNQSGKTCVMYIFSGVADYSDFGTYEGTGSSSSSPLVLTNLEPNYIMFKNIDASAQWAIYDNQRDPYNAADKMLFADSPGSENVGNVIDWLANGVKIRGTSAAYNASNTYVYVAFGQPFAGSSPATAR